MTAAVKITRNSATAEIARIRGHDAFQDHTRSLILIAYQSKPVSCRMRLPIGE